jgi:hypothetical protein
MFTHNAVVIRRSYMYIKLLNNILYVAGFYITLQECGVHYSMGYVIVM